MLRRLALAATLVLAAVGVARAERVVLVELYTSQGCSSCPPADALIAQLADRDDVIALALHVDYWDYIGWADDFARPAHTDRQRGYAASKGKKMIYTPQIVVNGETHIVGAKAMELSEALNKHRRGADPVDVSLDRNGGAVTVTARARGDLPSNIAVHIVTYTPSETRSIRRGENAGRTLTYHNIVTDWRTIGTWSGDEVYRAQVDLSEATPVVAIVQAGANGPVLGAARLR